MGLEAAAVLLGTAALAAAGTAAYTSYRGQEQAKEEAKKLRRRERSLAEAARLEKEREEAAFAMKARRRQQRALSALSLERRLTPLSGLYTGGGAVQGKTLTGV